MIRNEKYNKINLTLSASSMSQILTPVAGLNVGNVFPLTEMCHSLLIKICNTCVQSDDRLYIRFLITVFYRMIMRSASCYSSLSTCSVVQWFLFPVQRSDKHSVSDTFILNSRSGRRIYIPIICAEIFTNTNSYLCVFDVGVFHRLRQSWRAFLISGEAVLYSSILRHSMSCKTVEILHRLQMAVD